MILHKNAEAFRLLIDNISEKYKIRRDVLEKDYYVTLILYELSQKPKQEYAYFKGGTALYKALKSIRRFSEDIDLTVFIDDCPNNSQAKKRLVNSTLKYKSLPFNKILASNKSSITCEYSYHSIFNMLDDDPLQRFGNVRIESTSFTISEPTELIKIAPHLYELSGDDDKRILEEKFNIIPFDIETITLERIFIDKIFAAQFYYERGLFDDVAKHIYDLAILFNNQRIKDLFLNYDRLENIIKYKRLEEQKRKGGVSSELAINSFWYFDGFKNNLEIEKAFVRMQNIYVFNQTDKLDINYVCRVLREIQNQF